MIEPIILNEFEETRHIDPPKCEDELAQTRLSFRSWIENQICVCGHVADEHCGGSNECNAEERCVFRCHVFTPVTKQWLIQRRDELAQLRRELEMVQSRLKMAQSIAIQAKAQAVTVAVERDELRRELKAARDELAVYRLASETAMYEAGQFDAGLFLSGDRGVEDVMRRVLNRLAETERKAIEQSEFIQSHGLTEFEMNRLKAELALWKRRAEAQLKITEAAINLTLTPLYEMQAANGAYYVSPGHYERLRRACAEFKRLADGEAAR